MSTSFSKLLVAIALLISTITIGAQTGTTGRLIGTVSGPDGVLPGAVVTITDNQTGTELTATTNTDGGFVFPSLSVGTYTLKATASGFKSFTAEKLKIDSGRDYTLPVALEIGAISESVTVTAGADIVNATGGDLSTTISP